ncbi:DUF4442 domain-containing protein [Luteipulveratus mongoliensis]|uniref:Tetrameric acyl-CoA thioesterase n=1 Tax=Luteipulveratus mongoliensis TaxID=571913 RepID=A0A0K1JIH5_9MICO|nr:DUF4442 domain-containing protein [Luteipulveratus mongoliensis]AKU16506.1 tetrameric acyl-CoA thioesterase [Luteipulveratus mongoliensis]
MSTDTPYRSRKHLQPQLLARVMNYWPPMLGTGIRVQQIADDWTRARVKLPLTRLNRNQHGTAFGGSIGAMSDGFYALLLMHQLGKDYKVWDQAAEIEYVSPGTGTIYAIFEMPVEVVADIRRRCEGGGKVLQWFETDLTLRDGTVVARVRRQVYARKKREAAAT